MSFFFLFSNFSHMSLAYQSGDGLILFWFLLLWLDFKAQEECLTSKFNGQLSNVLIIHLCPDFWLIGYEVGQGCIGNCVSHSLNWFIFSHGVILQLQNGQSPPEKFRFKPQRRRNDHQTFMLDFRF